VARAGPPSFPLVLAAPPRLAAVDYGTKRVGLALADPLRLFAQPLGTWPPDGAVEELQRIHREQGLEAVVVGWPLTPDGEEGAATARVRPFVNRLRRALPGVEVVTWDERYSSQDAAAALREAGVRQKARREKGRVDRAAAAVILQQYLDAA
jgi:putative holliday junction resolvase